MVIPPVETKVGTQVLTSKPVIILKYVDDCLSLKKLNFGTIVATPSGDTYIKVKQTSSSQNAFLSVKFTAEQRGMVVNANKTQILCISGALN